MVYGETGRGLILNHVKCRIVNFWLRILRGKVSKYSYVLLKFISAIHKDENLDFTSSWLNFIEDTFNQAGLSNVWLGQNNGLGLNINSLLKLRLNDIFVRNGESQYGQIVFCTNYRIFKGNHEFENYLLTLNKTDAFTLCKFRCRSHKLPVNKGRFNANMHTTLWYAVHTLLVYWYI